MDRFQLVQHPPEAFIAARAGPSALDAKAVALADDVDVRQMHDPPQPGIVRPPVEGGEIARLGHGGVGHAPDEGGDGEIGADQDDAVGKRHADEAAPAADLGEAAEQLCARPNEIEHEQGNGADQEPGGKSRGCAQFRVLILARRLDE